MTMSKKEAYFAAIRSDLKAFLGHAFCYLHPGKELMGNWHIDAVLHCLEQSIEGTMPRLIINMPPRHLKSIMVSVVLPAFILGLDPTAKIICVSYSDELARALARDFRRIVSSQWYRRLFPEVGCAKDTEVEFVTDQGGGRFATSVNGTLTGRGGDFVIIDDPIKPEETHSDRIRQATNEWVKSTLLSRLDDKARSVLILVMQRLHVNDLTGYLEGTGSYHKLSLPAIAESSECIQISKTNTWARNVGEALHEERESLSTLERIRDQIGTYNFAAQYQQRPEAPEGGLFKRKYLQFSSDRNNIPPGGHCWASIDSAWSTSETADYSAITVGYYNAGRHYVLEAARGRWDYEELLAKTNELRSRFRNLSFIVERAGSGIPLISSLERRGIPFFFHTPREDKMFRAARVLPVFHEGRVHILNEPGNNAWVEPYVNELLSFPNGRFDDQVDSLVQGLWWAESRFRPIGRITF